MAFHSYILLLFLSLVLLCISISKITFYFHTEGIVQESEKVITVLRAYAHKARESRGKGRWSLFRSDSDLTHYLIRMKVG